MPRSALLARAARLLLVPLALACSSSAPAASRSTQGEAREGAEPSGAEREGGGAEASASAANTPAAGGSDERPSVPEMPRRYEARTCSADAECRLDPGFPCNDSICGTCPHPAVGAVHREAFAEAERACRAHMDARRALREWQERQPRDGAPAPIATPPNCSPCPEPPPARFESARCSEGTCVPVPIR